MGVGRRALLQGLAAAAAVPSYVEAIAQPSVQPVTARRRILIKGGYVASLDKSIEDLPVGDVLTDGATIAAIGRNIQALDAEVIDALRPFRKHLSSDHTTRRLRPAPCSPVRATPRRAPWRPSCMDRGAKTMRLGVGGGSGDEAEGEWQLSPGQLDAGRRIEELFDATESGDLRSMDMTRDVIDCVRPGHEWSGASRVDALKTLRELFECTFFGVPTTGPQIADPVRNLKVFRVRGREDGKPFRDRRI